MFGLKSKEHLHEAEKIINRDKRVQVQYEDAKKINNQEKLVWTLIFMLIATIFVFTR